MSKADMIEKERANYWNPPKMFDGKTVFIVGGGTSLRSFNFNLLKDKSVIGCNDAYKFGDLCQVCVFGDKAWLNYHKDFRKDFKGIMVTIHRTLDRPQAWNENDIKVMKKERRGFYTTGWQLAWNDNTGALAVNLAAILGAKEIVLLGFDMHLGTDGQANWHPNLKEKPKTESYPRFVKGFRDLKYGMDKLRPDIRVINVNNNSSLPWFEKMKIEDYFGGSNGTT
jgi:hypothetical protein